MAADVDGDGLEEIVIVYQQANEAVYMVVMQDESDGFTLSTPLLIDLEDRDQLFLAPGDFNGDASVDVVIGLVSYGFDSSLVMLENVQGSLVLSNRVVTLPRMGGVETHLVLSAGNVDYDVAAELGVVVNEADAEITSLTRGLATIKGTARYFLLDDANEGFAELQSGPADIDVESGVVRAVVADIALGDVDGDGDMDAATGAKGGPQATSKGEWFAWWRAGASPSEPWTKQMISDDEPGATNIHI